ncbi:hypothetical protein OZX73_03495 [Bifidobacterium sp. ESL0775]|uniref:hypothetical protein n=1 Tax=Bifidobacterium sp. ESL0775 TaxID=2983230 RepID=UPI0023F86261|nr:hypothetical protein [Bifidobacterium sp. ESL0775]WEV69937.1 hypothetical protein OZX73_03495 [Bifidobacterium sp. ESL0775]
MTSNNQLQENAGTMTLEQPQRGDEGPTILHYVRKTSCQAGRSDYSLCGLLMDHLTPAGNLPGGSETLICPMCEMDAQAELDGWPDSPLSIDLLAIRMTLNAMLRTEGLTIPEAAGKLGMEPDDLHHKLATIRLNVEELAGICELCHTSPAMAADITQKAAQIIKQRRTDAAKTE